MDQLCRYRADHTVIGMAISAIRPPSEDDFEIALVEDRLQRFCQLLRRAVRMVRRDAQSAISESKKNNFGIAQRLH